MTPNEPVGSFALVLHSHLPWLAHHGSWPVGEEWLYQSWSSSYLPVFRVLEQLASEGRTDLVTLGMTPVLAAQLDDPYCLSQFETWMGFWVERANQLASHPDDAKRTVGQYEAKVARECVDIFSSEWASGGSTIVRRLSDSHAIELLSGPATHPFQPLLDDEIASFALAVGRNDTQLRTGCLPTGIWAPECGYRPGLEETYAAAGVSHFMVDGPTLLHVGRSTADAWTIGDTDVVAFGRDLGVTYRVWSPRKGYPGGAWYRDFHTFEYDSGIRPSRVTSTRTPSESKAPYEPLAARAAVEADARDFVDVVRRRLTDLRAERNGKPGLVVVGYDTELFGHWWHEGPMWLDRVLRLLPEAGVKVTTLGSAISDGAVAGSASPRNSSWGSGKDWSVWAGDAVTSMVEDNDGLMRTWRKLIDDAVHSGLATTRSEVLDQLARNALLALSSDWAFMVSKDSAAQYARDRHRQHHRNFVRLANAVRGAVDGRHENWATAVHIAGEQRRTDGPFGHLDGRLLGAALGGMR